MLDFDLAEMYQGVAMLSGLLNSDVAISVNIAIMRTFVAVREMLLNSPTAKVSELQSEMKQLKEYIEEVFTDYNDVNEDTRTQPALINESLSELQVKYKHVNRPRNPIGFVIPNNN